MLEPNALKKGVIFTYKGNPVQVIGFSHTHKGRGSAHVTTKIRDLITGNVETKTFKAGEKVEEADLESRSASFLYTEREGIYFMDSTSFEEIRVQRETIEGKCLFLKEGAQVMVIEFEGRPIDIDLPPKVELSVAQTEPGVKGDTASGTVFKRAVLETGYEIDVPIFVKQGDAIRVNTETGEYVERV